MRALPTVRCDGGVTIVAESGAGFTLLDGDRNGRVDGVDLQSKAVLVEVPKHKHGRRFEVITPQAIAAVRGTQWVVDAEGCKTPEPTSGPWHRATRIPGSGTAIHLGRSP